MYDKAIEILKILNSSGFLAYIVGGYPRDRYLGITCTDIDICTSATPDNIASLFTDTDMTNSSYGAVRLTYGGYSYELTTFRRDNSLLDGNRSYSIDYVSTLEEDLLRRDFVMNTLCIDQYGEYVDLLGAITDIDNGVIRTVIDPSISFREDPLRILRAIRFSVTLGFSLSKEIVSILSTLNKYLSKLSFYRIKKELDLIFSNKNCMQAICYFKEFNLDEYLFLNVDNVKYCSNYLGIWAQCVFGDNYPFTKFEKDMIRRIRYVINEKPSMMVLYKYGINICQIYDEVYENPIYSSLNKLLPITKRDDICIDKSFLLEHVDHCLISSLYEKLEEDILSGNLINERERIERYILKYLQKNN